MGQSTAGVGGNTRGLVFVGCGTSSSSFAAGGLIHSFDGIDFLKLLLCKRLIELRDRERTRREGGGRDGERRRSAGIPAATGEFHFQFNRTRIFRVEGNLTSFSHFICNGLCDCWRVWAALSAQITAPSRRSTWECENSYGPDDR